MKKRITLVCIFLSVLTLFVGACGRKTNDPASDPNVGKNDGEPGESESEAVAAEWPEDIPRPETAYDIDISHDASGITFKMPGNIDSVVAYLQEEFESIGWVEKVPDSVVGYMAAINRTNEAGDTLVINMSYNQLGDFVELHVAIIRTQ